MSLSKEQLAHRSESLGASEMPAVAEIDPFSSPHDVFARKTGLVEPDETFQSLLGNRIEDLIADIYREQSGVDLLPCGTMTHSKQPWLTATPDRKVVGQRRLVELKNVGYRMVDRWEDGVPEYVVVQCQVQMGVTGFDAVDVATLLGGRDFVVHTVERDDEMFASLLVIGKRFWFDHVVPKVPPRIDGSESALRYLQARHPRNFGTMLPATPESDLLASVAAESRRKLARAESEKEEAENRLRALIGDHDGIRGEAWKATWKRAKDSDATDWREVAAALAKLLDAKAVAPIVQQHTTARPGSRRFLFSYKGA
jgi:putative phage-type endonuclease